MFSSFLVRCGAGKQYFCVADNFANGTNLCKDIEFEFRLHATVGHLTSRHRLFQMKSHWHQLSFNFYSTHKDASAPVIHHVSALPPEALFRPFHSRTSSNPNDFILNDWKVKQMPLYVLYVPVIYMTSKLSSILQLCPWLIQICSYPLECISHSNQKHASSLIFLASNSLP